MDGVSSRDGGYGWVIVMAFFVVEILVDGVRFSYGLYFVEFLSEFKKTRAETAWIGATMIVVYNLAGPVFAFIVNKMGYRTASTLGALIASIGLILSSFANELFHLYFSYGVLQGFGHGLLFLAGTVAISHYFLKKRAIAIGIAYCGSGVGLFAVPPLVSSLFETYTWRGSLFIIAGLVMNCCVFCSCYRPFNDAKLSDTEKVEECNDTPLNCSSMKAVEEHIIVETQKSLLSTDDGSDLNVSRVIKKPQSSSSPRSFADMRKEQLGSIRQEKLFKSSQGKKMTVISQSILGSNASFHSIIEKHGRNSNLSLQRSTFYKNEKIHSHKKQFKIPMIEHVFPRELVTNSDFIIMMTATLLIGTPSFIPFSMLPDYSLSIGTTSAEGAWLLSAIGIGGTFGRIGAGILSGMDCVHNLTLNSVCYLVIGVTTIAVALMPVYEFLLVYASLYGVFFGAVYVVQPIVLIEYLTEQYISEVMGLMMCTYGVSCCIGSPLAGWIFDVTGSYRITFLVAGVLFTLGGVVNFLVLCPKPKLFKT